MSPHSTENAKPLNLVIIGCGKLGTSVLVGLYKAYVQDEQLQPLAIFATVRSSQSQERIEHRISQLKAEFGSPPKDKCRISIQSQNVNHALVSKADIVVLACKPSMYEGICRGSAPSKACSTSSSQIWISLVGGKSCARIASVLHRNSVEDTSTPPCLVVRAIPNIAAQTRQSMTTLAVPDKHRYNPDQVEDAVGKTTQLFNLVGTTMWVPENVMDVTSTVGASSVALFATIIDQVTQGAYASSGGMTREALLEVAAHAAYGAAALVIQGMPPHAIVDQVATRGGSTRAGLDVLETSKSELAIRAAIEATIAATQGLSNTN